MAVEPFTSLRPYIPILVHELSPSCLKRSKAPLGRFSVFGCSQVLQERRKARCQLCPQSGSVNNKDHIVSQFFWGRCSRRGTFTIQNFLEHNLIVDIDICIHVCSVYFHEYGTLELPDMRHIYIYIYTHIIIHIHILYTI